MEQLKLEGKIPITIEMKIALYNKVTLFYGSLFLRYLSPSVYNKKLNSK